VEDDQEDREYSAQSILVVGFLGGIVFTALALVLQSRDAIEAIGYGFEGVFYFQILITVMGIDSVCFIVSSIIMIETASQRGVAKSPYGASGRWLMVWGVILLFVIIPFILLPYTLYGAIIVFAFSMIILVLLTKLPH